MSENPSMRWPPHAGEMAQRIREFPWASTSWGAIECWPQNLRAAIDIMLCAPAASYVWWGTERLQVYNDAAIDIDRAKHPGAFAQPATRAWSGAWELIGELEERVRATGRGASVDDRLLSLERGDELEPSWFRFSMTPLHDEEGDVAGALIVATDTTRRVRAETSLLAAERQQRFLLELSDELRDRADPIGAAARACQLLGRELDVGRCGYGEVDASGEYFTVERDWTDGRMASLAGRIHLADFGREVIEAFRRGEMVRLEDAALDPRTLPAARAYVGIGQMRAGIAVPLIKQGRFVAALYVHQMQPRRWTEDEVSLVLAVAERTWNAIERARADLALRRSEEFHRVSVVLGPHMPWTASPEGELTSASDRWAEFTGMPVDETLGERWEAAAHPDDLPGILCAWKRCVAAGTPYDVQARIRRADGTYGWCRIRAAPLRDADERIIQWYGSLEDVQERHTIELRVRESEERLRALVTATSDVVYRMSADWTEMRQLDGRGFLADTESPSVSWIEEYLFPEDEPAVRAAIDEAISKKGVFELEHRVRRVDGSGGWTLSRAIPLLDEQGSITQWFGMATDVTERRKTEAHLRLVVHELNHRVKNNLAMIQAIAAQTFRSADDLAQAQESFTARIVALAHASDLLTGERWVGASLRGIVEQALDPQRPARERCSVEGPDLKLSPKTALSLSLAMHELSTNAVKYGAWSSAAGTVSVSWSLQEATGSAGTLKLEWREAGGPPVAQPRRRGFGSRLIERGLAAEMGGEVQLIFKPEGLLCKISAPIERLGES
jgi:PAS domain S-box-containing protein